MNIILDIKKFQPLVPNAHSAYKNAAGTAQAVLDRHGITKTKFRLFHFLAQVMHESSGFSVFYENLNYSAKRLPQVWPNHFLPKGPLDPNQYEFKPELLANTIYGERLAKKMGNEMREDGYKYRGRGLLQITGKYNYRNITKIVKQYHPDCPDFVLDPDQVLSSNWCFEVAAAFWEASGCNEAADADNLDRVTRLINGGINGLSDRKEFYKKITYALS